LSSVKKNDTKNLGKTYHEFEIQKDKEKRLKGELIVEIIDSTTDRTINGIGSPMVGFIVKVNNPFNRVFFQELGEKQYELNKLGYARILNYTYKETGRVFSRFTVIDKGVAHWDIIPFTINITKDDSNPGDLITNVDQRKVVGMAAGGKGGLDVAFSISTGRTLKHILWIFGDEDPPISIQKPDSQVLEFATHHPYKNTKERYDASVTVWDHEDQSETIHFSVIMAEL